MEVLAKAGFARTSVFKNFIAKTAEISVQLPLMRKKPEFAFSLSFPSRGLVSNFI
ncbi:MAG: hypothetical protein FWH41_07690 [Treponema sp.]|nr:hypothetical protein [Treponema sp.]